MRHVNLLTGRTDGQPAASPFVGATTDRLGRVMVERTTTNLLPNPTFAGLVAGTVGGIHSPSGRLPTGFERGTTVNCDVLPAPPGRFRWRFRRYIGLPTATNFQMRTPAAPGLTPASTTRGGVCTSGHFALLESTPNVKQLTVEQLVYKDGSVVRRATRVVRPGDRPRRLALWTTVGPGETVLLSMQVDLTTGETAANDDFTAVVECWDLQMEDASGVDDATTFVAGTRATPVTATLPVTGQSSVLLQTDRGGFWFDTDGDLTIPTDRSFAVAQAHIRPRMDLDDKNELTRALHPPAYDQSIPSAERLELWGRNPELQRPAAANTLGIARNRRGLVRFETLPGQQWGPDIQNGNTNERSEVRFYEQAPYDTDVWVSRALLVEPGPALTNFLILSQWHATEDQGDAAVGPVFSEVLLEDQSFAVFTRSDPNPTTVTNPQQVRRYTDQAFERGSWHYLVHKLRFSTSGGGHLTTWHNGVQVFSGDVPLGFNDTRGPYFKVGIYKGTSPEPVAVQTANVEVTTADLSARVSNPLPIA